MKVHYIKHIPFSINVAAHMRKLLISFSRIAVQTHSDIITL